MGIGSNLPPKTSRTKQIQYIKQPFKVGNEQKKTVISERRETNEVSPVMFPSHHLESFQDVDRGTLAGSQPMPSVEETERMMWKQVE